MKKSILAILLALVMVASLLPFGALADDTWAEVNSAEALTTALQNGGNIKLTADISVATKQNWRVEKDVVLDLNNFDIVSSYGENNNFLFTVSGASFTVTDNSADKTGTIEATDSSCGYGIQLKGTNSSFILRAGTIKTTQETVDIYTFTTGCKIEISGGKLISTDDSAMNARGKSTVVNITGGELISEGGIAGIFVSSGGSGSTDVNSISFNMTGGSLVSDAPGILTDYALTVNIGGTANISSSSTGISVKGTTVLNVNGGTIASSGASAISANHNNKVNISGGNISTTGYSAAAIQIGEDSTATISGGNVSSKNTNKNITGSADNITISGGTFQQNVSAYLSEGLTQDDKGNVVINTEDKNVVASIGNRTFNNFHDAVAAAQSGETVKLWKNTTVDSWEQIWNLSVVTIDGQGNELTVNAVTSNGNGDYLVYGAEDLNVKDLTIKFTTNGNGFTLDSGKFESVNMYAGSSSSYAIFVDTSAVEGAKVEVESCYFKGFSAAVYSQPGNGTVVTSDISITKSTFDDCGMSVCSYAAETVFNGNIVRDCDSNSFAGGVDKGNTNVTYEIKNNTFENGGKIWFYDGNLDNVVFEKNSVQGNTYLTTDDSNGGTLDVSNNYWGGDAPSEKQIQGEGNVTGKDKYYLEPTMDDDDISVFYDVYYVYNNGVGMGHYRVLKGESVTLPTPSKSGYAFLGWACTDGKVYDGGDSVAIWGNTTFEASWVRHPDTPYVPEPEEPEKPEVPAFPFYDVPTSAWYYTAVKYVYDNKLMDGVDTYVFAPNDTLTRAMVWTIIARMSGVDTTGGNTWYAKAQEWVITNGISDGENPTAAITREQLVTMLYRYAQIKGYDVSVGENTNILSYVDATSISEYAMSAFQWACGSGLTEGDENGALTPLATATRAQAAAMIMRFCQSVK